MTREPAFVVLNRPVYLLSLGKLGVGEDFSSKSSCKCMVICTHAGDTTLMLRGGRMVLTGLGLSIHWESSPLLVE